MNSRRVGERSSRVDRRTVLVQAMGAFVATDIVTGSPALGQAGTACRRGSMRPGLQLFSILPLIEADIDAALKDVAAIGYRDVETVGSFGRPAGDVRRTLDRYGLRSPAQHMMPDDLYRIFASPSGVPGRKENLRRKWLHAFGPDGIDQTLKNAMTQAKLLGQDYVVWQFLWDEQMNTPERMQWLCRTFNRLGQQCADNGLRFAFHNQAAEMKPIAGMTPFDILLNETDPALVDFEMDFDAILRGGKDPFAYLRDYPTRFRLFHFKDCTIAVSGPCALDSDQRLMAMIDGARAAGILHAFFDYENLAEPLRVVRGALDHWMAIDADRGSKSPLPS